MNTTKNWIAAFAAAAGLGVAIVNASAVASANPGATAVAPAGEAPSDGGSDGGYESSRRRATFAGASITEVKLDDLDAGNKK
jgi:hypothetical protein